MLLLGMSAGAAAQERGADRAGSWEVGFSVFDVSSDSVTGDGGSSVDIDGEIGFGAVGGYNVTNRFAVLAEVNWSEPDFTATLPLEDTSSTARIDAELEVASIHLKGVFYFMDSDFTPYVELGGGWTRIDTNIVEGPPTTGCWWDPWWGFVCADFYETYHETRSSYSTAFGVRWDLSPETLLKVSWGTLQIDASSRMEDPSHDVFRADFSWKF